MNATYNDVAKTLHYEETSTGSVGDYGNVTNLIIPNEDWRAALLHVEAIDSLFEARLVL